MISAIATIALSLLHIMEKNIVMDIMMEQFKLIGTLKVGMIWT